MEKTLHHSVLSEIFGSKSGMALRYKQAALVVAGVVLLALAAKIKVLPPERSLLLRS